MGTERDAENRKYAERIRHRYSERFYNNTLKVIDFVRMPKWFFKDIVVRGVENVRKVEDKQLFYFANHFFAE